MGKIIQPPLPGLRYYSESNHVSPPKDTRDVNLNEFLAFLPAAIHILFTLYVSNDEIIKDAFLNQLENILFNCDEFAESYPYLALTIVHILQDSKYQTSITKVSYSKEAHLKQDIVSVTMHFYLNILKNGEVYNGTAAGSISSSRLLIEIMNKNADYTVGYFLYMYWLALMGRSVEL